MIEHVRNEFNSAFKRIIRECEGTEMSPGDLALLDSFALHCCASPGAGPLHLKIFRLPNETKASLAMQIAPVDGSTEKLLWIPYQAVPLRAIDPFFRVDKAVDQDACYSAESYEAIIDELRRDNWRQIGEIPTGPDAQPIYGLDFEDARKEPPARAALRVIGLRAQLKCRDLSIGEMMRREAAGEELYHLPRQIMLTATHLAQLRRD